MLTRRPPRTLLIYLLLTTAIAIVTAHGADHGDAAAQNLTMGPPMDHDVMTVTNTPSPISYYNHPAHAGWLYAHIATMSFAWIVLLPIAVFLSSARTRLAIPAQFLFMIVNAMGLVTGVIYNKSTPDLYPNNAHHKFGWAVTWIAVIWVLLGFFTAHSHDESDLTAARPALAITPQTVNQYQRLQHYDHHQEIRWSRDSGHGSSRTQSTDSVMQKPETDPIEQDDGLPISHDNLPSLPAPDRLARLDDWFEQCMPRLRSGRVMSGVTILHVILERVQVLLSFVALATGLITWWGIFHTRSGLLGGLAHWIKGAIFVWYGLLTLGRWMGAFSNFGWAWNIRPEARRVSRLAARMPSAEFTESFVIFFYGATNVFLEHLSSWGKEWSPIDLEHISITIMFFGGGLLGMAVESSKVRDLLNTTVEECYEDAVAGQLEFHEEASLWTEPKTYRTSLNPLPALVIFLLGLLMSAHHQNSMVSTMVHKQWGTLFSGFALARIMTYVMMYIKPPKTYFPTRPPTELIAAFCLTCGGFIFMASTSDVVEMLERNSLHAMFVLTVTIGLTCLLMVWVVALYAMRGLAVRRRLRLGH